VKDPDNRGKHPRIDGKTMGKPWENHRKTMGKPWENDGLMGFNGIYI